MNIIISYYLLADNWVRTDMSPVVDPGVYYGGPFMTSAVAQAYKGIWGLAPSVVQG